jgi:hypothetical protein
MHEVHVPVLLPPKPSIPKHKSTFYCHLFCYTVNRHGHSLCITLVVLSLRCVQSVLSWSPPSWLGLVLGHCFVAPRVFDAGYYCDFIYIFFWLCVVVVGHMVLALACWLVPVWISGQCFGCWLVTYILGSPFATLWLALALLLCDLVRGSWSCLTCIKVWCLRWALVIVVWFVLWRVYSSCG